MWLQTSCAQFRAVETLPISGFVSEDTLGLQASCQVAFAITKEKKPHTIGELLIKPYTIDVVEKRTKEKTYEN